MLKIKKILINSFLFSLIAVFSFFFGMRYEQYSESREVLIIFANMLGDQLIEINRVYDELDSAPIATLRARRNESFLIDIGCSKWLESLDGYKKDKLSDFEKGVNEAYKHASGLMSKDNACLNNLKRFGIIKIEERN